MNIKNFIDDYLIPQNKWQNYGDVNYVEYGGVQLKYSGRDNIDILELITPDAHGEDLIILFSGWLTLSDIILDYSENKSLDSIRFDFKRLKGLISFIGIESLIEEFHTSYDPGILKQIIDSICCGAISYGLTGEVDREWHFKDYKDEVEEGDDIESYMLRVVTKDLKKMGVEL